MHRYFNKTQGFLLTVLALGVNFILLNLIAWSAGEANLVKDIGPGAIGSELTDLTNVNGTLFFRANDIVSGTELWKSDGTAAGTILVKDINPGLGDTIFTSARVNVNGTLFFAANDRTTGNELWKSDGTAAGTVLVRDIRPGSGNFPF